MDLKKYIGERREAVDAFFHSYFRELRKPSLLQEAMLYSLFAGGKRIRPILALAAYESCGGDTSEIVPYASTLELIHTYSLIHDDLPAMDNDDLRRGKPTSHKIYGEAIAILAGDALLTEAFSILSDPSLSNNVDEVNLLRALREIAVASGLNGMVAGQVQDLLSENFEPDRETLEFIHMRKTAALIRASVMMGPILYGSGKAVCEALSEYGNKIGLAFQVIDDILDIEGDAEEIGKPVGSDEKSNKMTYPRLYGIEKSRAIAQELIASALSSISMFSSDADPLREIANYLLNRRS
ncbi:MAG: polyprenyl synthetase family protein [Nitrospiraceae bacterium]|jgi:geranylgeranyl diphosphate synthase, type II|nr:MAG: polyprenyl synthetase family protein [Nitrospiraceae bacterium]